MAAKIKHGRRVGQLRDPNNKNLLGRIDDPRQVAILQAKDWRRICTELTQYDHEAEIHKAMLKKQNELHAKSKEIVKHWGNTIEGQRLQKLQSKKIRDEADEEEKKKLDRVEAEFQAQKRKDAIKWAKQQLDYQTDRAKNFHGALIMTEVLKEREAQLKMKDDQKKCQQEREERYLEHQQMVNNAATIEENQKAAARLERAKQTADFQLSQMNDTREQREIEWHDNMEEGKRLQKQSRDFVAAKAAIAMQRREDKKALMKSYLKELEFKQEREQQERNEGEMFNLKLRRFANAKKKMALTRKQKEEEMFDQSQKRTERMCKKMEDEMRRKVDDEDDRIVKVINERAAKEIKAEEEEHEKRLEELAKIDEFREGKMRIKEAEVLKEAALDQATLQHRFANDRKYHRRQEEIRNERRRDRKKVEDCHKHQIALRVEASRKARAAQSAWGKQNVQKLVEEEAEFQRYAKKVIEDAKERDRDIYPLIKATQEGPGGGRGPKFNGCGGLRPSYMASDATAVQLPHYPKDENVLAREKGQIGKIRLGFTW